MLARARHRKAEAGGLAHRSAQGRAGQVSVEQGRPGLGMAGQSLVGHWQGSAEDRAKAGQDSAEDGAKKRLGRAEK